MWGKKQGRSQGLLQLDREFLGPLFLTATPPPSAVLLVAGFSLYQGQWFSSAVVSAVNEYLADPWSFYAFAQKLPLALGSALAALPGDAALTAADIWAKANSGDHGTWATAATCMAVFAAVEILFLRLLPGKPATGPRTATGHIPRYTDNGLLSYLLTVVLFLAGTKEVMGEEKGLYHGSIVAKNMLPIILLTIAFTLPFIALLAIKGAVAPSTADSGRNSNVVMDYYWGTELYPRILGVDVKVWANCRWGMMSWAIIAISSLFYSAEKTGLPTWAATTSVLLQLVYITKFFYWEVGYFSSIDIMHDRAGFYLVGGCLIWVPALYSSPGQFWGNYGASGKEDISATHALVTMALGVLFIFLNLEADQQRSFARKTAHDPTATMWGSRPKLIEAHYETTSTDEDGNEVVETHTSFLLASHLWGSARHLHYVFEVLAAICWSVPAAQATPLAYAYVAFLTLLLFDRAVRDDYRCADKYGDHWKVYCLKVPYFIIPGIF